MNNQFEVLHALKINFNSSYLISYAYKLHMFQLSLYIHPKKSSDFYSKLDKVHRAIQAHDFWSRTRG